MKRRNPSCPIDGCDHNILPTSKYGVCGRHTEILAAFDWYLDKLAKAQGDAQTSPLSSLVLPKGVKLPLKVS